MRALIGRVAQVVVAVVPLIGGCAIAPAQAPGESHGRCLVGVGALADTLYAEQQLTDAAPPTPRPSHLAPYPPSADGEDRLWFRDQVYIASGMPVRFSGAGSSDYRIVRIGTAASVPLFALDRDAGRAPGVYSRVWAPITEDCVFLPFNHASEIR